MKQKQLNKVESGLVYEAPPLSAQNVNRKRDHYDITTAQLRDSAFDKTAYLEWLGGVAECDRVARIMLPFLVVSTSNDSTKSTLNKIA